MADRNPEHVWLILVFFNKNAGEGERRTLNDEH